tara:strand:+ start:183 stop:365 length:183 start_codon:yes stop_codon:yes gene_type:complete
LTDSTGSTGSGVGTLRDGWMISASSISQSSSFYASSMLYWTLNSLLTLTYGSLLSLGVYL